MYSCTRSFLANLKYYFPVLDYNWGSDDALFLTSSWLAPKSFLWIAQDGKTITDFDAQNINDALKQTREYIIELSSTLNITSQSIPVPISSLNDAAMDMSSDEDSMESQIATEIDQFANAVPVSSAQVNEFFLKLI